LSDSQKAEDNDAYFAKQFSSSRGLSKLEELKAHGARARGGHGGRGRGSGKIAASESPASPTDAKRTKVLRTWDDQPASGKSKKALNKSEETNEDDVAAARMKAAREEFGEAPAPGEAYAENSDYESDSEPAAMDVGKEPEAPKTGIFSFFSRLAGNQSLTRPDIEPVPRLATRFLMLSFVFSSCRCWISCDRHCSPRMLLTAWPPSSANRFVQALWTPSSHPSLHSRPLCALRWRTL